jgi:phosphate starvation-inducible membrane PsiE
MNKDLEQSNKEKKKMSTLVTAAICIYNWLEHICLLIMTFNSLFFPNFISSIYISVVILITLMSTKKDEKLVRNKQTITIFILMIAVIVSLGKAITLITLAV